jgi:HEAT repeat protein
MANAQFGSKRKIEKLPAVFTEDYTGSRAAAAVAAASDVEDLALYAGNREHVFAQQKDRRCV